MNKLNEKENKPARSRDEHVIQMRCELVLYSKEHMLHMAHNKQYNSLDQKFTGKKNRQKIKINGALCA